MKVVSLITVGLLVVSINAQENQLSDDEFAKKLEECQKQENATKADAETIANHNIPDTEGAQCIAACMMEATGVFKDGEISKDNYSELIAQFKFDKENSEQADKLRHTCGSLKDENRCALAEKLSKCMGSMEAQSEKLNVPENIDIFKMIRKQKEKSQSKAHARVE